MDKPNIREWSNEELIQIVRQWEIDSIHEFNQLANQPIENFRIASTLIKNLTDDNRFLLGVVAEISEKNFNQRQLINAYEK